MANNLLRDSSSKHLIALAPGKHLLRYGPMNTWITLDADAGANCYAYATTDYTSQQEYAGVQNYSWQMMAGAPSFASGYAMTLMYGGWSIRPSTWAVFQGSEALAWNTAWHFTVPTILNGHAITAARVLMCSPCCLVRNQYGDIPGISDFTWTNGALRLKFNTGLLAPIACLQSGYQLQIAANSLTPLTTATGAAKETYDIWGWDSTTEFEIPLRAATAWIPWDLPSSVVSILNSSRAAWLHAGWTQDYFNNAYMYLACASVRGFALQVYVT